MNMLNMSINKLWEHVETYLSENEGNLNDEILDLYVSTIRKHINFHRESIENRLVEIDKITKILSKKE